MAIKEKINQVKIEDEINNIFKDLNIEIVIPEDNEEEEDEKKDN